MASLFKNGLFIKRLFFNGNKTIFNKASNLDQLIRKNYSFKPENLNVNIKAVKINNLKESIQINFSNEMCLEFPWLFLQDNCTCSQCFHPSSSSRMRLMTELNLEKCITRIELSENKETVKCTWSDGHEGNFTKNWLLERSFAKENIDMRRKVLREDYQFVGSDFKIPRENFEDVLQDSSKLLKVLKDLAIYGIVLLEEAPLKTGQLRRIADKIAFMRTTHYGNEFTVKSEKNAVNLAYTSSTLNVHTDLPYYQSPPGTQLLHCIEQFNGEGGNTLIADGFYVCHQLKQKHPLKFQILSQVPVEFLDQGQDYTKFFKVHHSPIIVTNPENGKFTRIVFSNQQLSSYLPIPVDKVRSYYTALKQFIEICYDSRNLMKFKLKEGEILMFDNWRFLHGREGFDASKGGRHLEGCYIDWDEIYSTINVLEASQKI